MTPGADELEQLARRWIEGGWQRGEPAVVDDLHAEDFVDHDPAGRAPDREGFKQGIRNLYRAFPDFYAIVEDLIANENEHKVAIRWTARGTHQDTFMGILSTGRMIRFKGIEIIRVEAGRIQERWGEWDGLDLMEQLAARS